MMGAIIGDIVGSVYEFDNIKTVDFPLFSEQSRPTDDSVMSVAVAAALLKEGREDDSRLAASAVACMQEIGRHYPDCGYGNHFIHWIFSDDPQPYYSYGNGSAMRVSACGWAADSLEECLRLARIVTAVSHDHPEGIRGALAVTEAVWMARNGCSKDDIRKMTEQKYYALDFTLDDIRPDYDFDVTCQGSVPQAVEAFLESEGFEDAIRLAVSIGGDSDTIAAITGSIAEAFYGIPEELREQALLRMDDRLRSIIMKFEEIYPVSYA